MADDRAKRLAENESRFRVINDRVERDLERIVYSPHELLPFVCECARRTCSATIELARDDYERVRADSVLFAIAPGHEVTDVEDVVERHDGYYVIRKHPETWDVAKASDPRR
jgi:hypothetical protein